MSRCITAMVVLTIAGPLAVPTALARQVLFVPAGYPVSAEAFPIGPAHAEGEQRFCNGGFHGLDLARRELGFAPCGGNALSSEVLTGGGLTGVDIVILVDDTGGITPELADLLAGAIQRPGDQGMAPLMPFGMVLPEPRAAIPAGTRVLLIGERAFRDIFEAGAGDDAWRRLISYQYRYTSRPRLQLRLRELTSREALEPIFHAGLQEYDNGNFELAAEYFAQIYRVAGMAESVYQNLEHNIARSLWSAAIQNFIHGDYELSLEIWEQLLMFPLFDRVPSPASLHRNTAIVLIRLGREEEAQRRFGISAGPETQEPHPDGPLDPALRNALE